MVVENLKLVKKKQTKSMSHLKSKTFQDIASLKEVISLILHACVSLRYGVHKLRKAG